MYIVLFEAAVDVCLLLLATKCRFVKCLCLERASHLDLDLGLLHTDFWPAPGEGGIDFFVFLKLSLLGLLAKIKV